MTDLDLCYLSAGEALRRFRAKSLSPLELVEALIQRCQEVNPKVNAFTYTYFERSRQKAKAAERVYFQSAGNARPLEGIPLVVKDGTAVKGEITTYGSKVYENYRPETTHPALERLLQAGAILLARTTMPEFGEAANCYTPLWGVTRNPWNLEYGPGGSSSGAGAALAAGMTTLADGSDIGGSIRIPAACCGVIGYKPPYGRNPVDLPNSFDPYYHYGPLTRTVGDAALMQNILSGWHVEDIGSLREKLIIPESFETIRGWRIAYSLDLGYFQVDEEVCKNMLQIMEIFRGLGCQVEEVNLSWSDEVYQAWKTINSSRGSAARRVKDRDAWRSQLADYTVDWLDTGSQVSPEQVVRAYEVQVELYRVMGPLLERYDLFVCPTNAIPSIEAERSPLDLNILINGQPASQAVAEAWFMTYPFNILSQLPVMSVPSGFSTSGVPTGVQLAARSYEDVRVFRAAAALEKEMKWYYWRPSL